MLRKLILTTAAAALAAAPVAAQAAQATPARASSPMAQEEQLGGAMWPVLAAVGFALVLLFLLDDDSDNPTSP